MHDLRDVGGTSGGLVEFLAGLGMAVLGAYLLLDRITVSSGYWQFGAFGHDHSFGVSLIPVVLGVGMLFYNAGSVLGWLLFGGGLVFIVAGVLAHLQVYFQPTTLINTVIILGTWAGGIGLILRSLLPRSRR